MRQRRQFFAIVLIAIHLVAIVGIQAHFHGTHLWLGAAASKIGPASHESGSSDRSTSGSSDHCVLCSQGFAPACVGVHIGLPIESAVHTISELHPPQKFLSDYFGAVSRRGPPVDVVA